MPVCVDFGPDGLLRSGSKLGVEIFASLVGWNAKLKHGMATELMVWLQV